MKKTSIWHLFFLLFLLLSSAGLGTAVEPAPTNSLFLPLVGGGGGAPLGSVALIDQAVEQGRIGAETGLIYKVFATFGDPRLPAAYRGGIGREGDGVIEEVLAQSRAGALSPEGVALLAPFFVPPDSPGSWYEKQQPPGAAPGAPRASWVGIEAAGGKVQIIWEASFAVGPDKAAGLQAALDARIWPKLTDLMGREPRPDDSGKVRIYLWDSYNDSTGVAVPFDARTLGVAVPTDCDQSSAIIYLPITRPVGDETHAGLIQYATHELMHGIQFGMTIQNCESYRWLKEATANWSEEYVYKDANSEWVGDAYFREANVRLDKLGDLHEYGAYVLFYYLTHTVDTSAQVVRKTWENAATTPNSYLAFRNAVPEEQRDYFWSSFLLTLWNKAPYPEYYKNNDKLVASVKPEQPQPVPVTTAGEPFIYTLDGDLPTGAARYYHFTFPDSSVRSLTILNGLSYKLERGSILEEDQGFALAEDQTYLTSEITEAQAAGATLLGMMKAEGQSSWRFLPLGAVDQTSYCVDLEGKVEDLLLVQSNADWEHPDRIMQPQGLPTTVYASNMPCWKYQGTSKITIFNAGVTWTYSAANVSYGDPYNIPLTTSLFPYTQFFLLGADVNWSVSGTDKGGCTYSGSGSFHVNAHPGAGSDSIVLYNGILPGSPTYRGYYGQGDPDEGTPIYYTRTCKDGSTSEQDIAFSFLQIPLQDDRDNIKLSANGTLSGSYQHDDPWGDYIRYEWNLTPVSK